jgi:hypothetical protein
MILGAERVFAAFRETGPASLAPAELRQAIAQRVLSLWADEDTVAAHRLLHHATGRMVTNFAELNLEPEDQPFAKSILGLRGRFTGVPMAGTNAVSVSATSEDFLAAEIDKWSPIKALNFALLMALPTRSAAAVVATIRNEGISILEWIAHNRSIGFEKIFIYTNDNSDGSLPLLETLANAGEIRLIKNEVDKRVAPQAKAYEHSLQLLPELRDYEWVAFLDADEFLIGNAGPDHTVVELLQKLEASAFENISTIALNWKWFSSKAAYHRSEGLVLERFDSSLPNEHVKSIVKIRDLISMQRLHTPILFKGARFINGAFDQFDSMSVTTKPTYVFGQVNHYWAKSFEEFALKKVRGRGTQGLAGEQRDFSSFFDWDAPNNAQLDLPPSSVIERTRQEYNRLLSIADVAEHMRDVEERYVETLRECDVRFNLKRTYDVRGR